MQTHHDEPTIARLELIGHIAAALRLAMSESPDCDGVSLTVTAGPAGVEIDCMHTVQGVPVSGWGQ